MRDIVISNLVSSFVVNDRSLERMIHALDRYGKFSIPEGELSIAFVNVEEIQKLHKNFLSDDTITDVITFAGDKMFKSAGELVICPEYALDVCQSFGQTFFEEITLYIIHGYLHLAGLGDTSEIEQAEMRTGESYLMDLIKEKNCMPQFGFNIK